MNKSQKTSRLKLLNKILKQIHYDMITSFGIMKDNYFQVMNQNDQINQVFHAVFKMIALNTNKILGIKRRFVF